MISGNIKTDLLPLKELRPCESNPRKHPKKQIAALKNNIKEYGFYQPIIVDDKNEIIAGHGRYLAAKEMLLDKVPVMRLSGLSEKQKIALRIIDNKIKEMSLWDDDLFAAQMAEIADMDLVDFGVPALRKKDVGALNESSAEELSEQNTIKLGDVITLNNHVLVCGDSNAITMPFNAADMVFTDPPYGVAVKNQQGNILGDFTETALFLSVDTAMRATKPKAHIYMCGGCSNITTYQALFQKALNIDPKIIVWDKEQINLRQNGYHSQYELVFFGYKKGGGSVWHGERTAEYASDIWRVKRDAGSTYIHPTQKPTELAERAIKNSCPSGGSVLELFAGSGSTIIACEKTGRTCYAVELDPLFCSKIIQRYKSFCLTNDRQCKVQINGTTAP